MNTAQRQKVRKNFAEQYGPLCWWCQEDDAVSVDHIIPLSRGGCNHQHNIVGACFYCNETKSDDMWPEIPKALWIPLYNCDRISNDTYRQILRDYWEPPLFKTQTPLWRSIND